MFDVQPSEKHLTVVSDHFCQANKTLKFLIMLRLLSFESPQHVLEEFGIWSEL